MNALIVGAGAVGQVYGSHLQRGGAKVSFLVKEKYRAALEGGVDLYPLNDPAYRASPLRFSDYRLLTSDEQVASETWDQVYLTVSSTAVRGPWLGPLLKAIGKATVVSFQPGLEDRRYLLQWMPEEQLVAGTLTLISYQAPLPGETRFPRPGMAYWFPPMSASPFSGPSSRVKPVVDALNAGKLPAKIIADVPSQVAFPNAMLMPVLLGLESAGWSFAAFKSGEQLRWPPRARGKRWRSPPGSRRSRSPRR